MKKQKIDLSTVTIGADPELFLFSQSLNKPVTAIGLIKGTKEKPNPITKDGHYTQLDGVAMEFNIPPCFTSKGFVDNISFVREYLDETIAKPNGLELFKGASTRFDKDQLKTPECWEIGCSSDINAWSLNMNLPEPYQDTLRAVGGHVAVGYKDPQESTSIELIKAMDLFLTIPAILLDKDVERRKLYGKAGAMRFKPFGVEHRSLSNFWIFEDRFIEWVFNNTIKAIEFVNIGGIITNPEEIQKAINTCDKELALSIIEDYSIELPKQESLEDYFNELKDEETITVS